MASLNSSVQSYEVFFSFNGYYFYAAYFSLLIFNSFRRNKESQLKVYYELKPSGMMPSENVRKPLVTSVEEFNGGKFQWRELPQDKFTVDSEKGIVKAIIQPDEVLQIENEDSIAVEEKPSEHFDIKKLNLNGTGGLITFEGNQIYKQFQKENKSWFSPGGTVYVIYFK